MSQYKRGTTANSTQLSISSDPSQRYDVAASNLLPIYLLRFDRSQTRRAYRNDLQQFFETDEITLAMARRVTFVDVNNHIQRLEQSGARPATMKRRLAALRGFFEWLMALELVTTNPANRQLVRRIRSTRLRDRAITVLTRSQAARLLSATQMAGEAALRDHALVSTMIHCVLRRSEVAAMDVEHVRRIGEHHILDLPVTKGGADQFVKIPSHVAVEIESVVRHYGIHSGALWRSLSNNNRNRRLSPNAVYELVRRTAVRAGLSGEIGAHTLRHTGCTLAIESGATVQQVQAHARHKNIETTMVYVHQRDRLRDSAADMIKI
jgi:site-specific recombinase XerD